MTPVAKIQFVSVLLSLLAYAGGGQVDEDRKTCGSREEQEVEMCLQPMITYATGVQSHGLLPLQGEQVFKELCASYLSFKKCVAPLECRSVGPLAMEASYGYMCGAGHDLFIAHVPCFVQVEQDSAYANCKNTATTSINSLHLNETTANSYFDSLCTIMRSYLSCSKPIILRHCQALAWTLISKVTEESLRITMPKCDLSQVMQLKNP